MSRSEAVDVHGEEWALEGAGTEIPVEMPASMTISTPQQFKAISDPTRWRILGVLQMRAATAKQIADRLGVAPGTIGHHLVTLEAAGLVRVVATRVVRGIIAKYYARSARIFSFDFPSEVVGPGAVTLTFLTDAREELAEALAADPAAVCEIGMPRASLTPERLAEFKQQLNALVDEFIHEPSDPEGDVYTLSVALFKAPPYLQRRDDTTDRDR